MGSAPESMKPLGEQSFHECISCVRADVDRTHDEVHRLIRLLACFEALIKLMASVAHAAMVDTAVGPPRWYQKDFHAKFIEKEPTLGDWQSLLRQIQKYFKKDGPPWLMSVLDPVFQTEHTKESAISKLCRAIDRTRQSTDADKALSRASIGDLVDRFVQLRNLCAHGAITVRFASKHGELLANALREIEGFLKMRHCWKFVVPLQFVQRDSKKALVLNPEDPRDKPKPMIIGERAQLDWERLYVGAADAESLDRFTRLSPLMLFDRTHDDYKFLNRFVEGEYEYLSYKSGDFDYQESSGATWEESFNMPSLDDDGPEQAAVEDTNVPATVEVAPLPAHISIDLKPDPIVAGPSVDKFVDALRFDDLSDRTKAKLRLDVFENDLAEYEIGELTTFFENVRKNLGEANAQQLQFLGNLQYRLGLFELSAGTLRELVAQASDDREALHLLGRSLFRYGANLKDRGRAEHDTSLVQRAKATLLEGAGVLERSLLGDDSDYFHRMRIVQGCSMLTDVYCRLGAFDKALEYCERGLSHDESNQRLNGQRLYLYERTGK